MGWDGMGRHGMAWDGMGWDGMGWDGMGRDGWMDGWREGGMDGWVYMYTHVICLQIQHTCHVHGYVNAWTD